MGSKDYLTNDKVPLSREVLLPGEEDSSSRSHLPIEDRVMKEVSQFFGQELMPRLGVKERVVGVAPTETVHLEMKNQLADFMFEMEDKSWRHLEFESDRVNREDLVRFRASEALTSHIYGVDVVTSVVCTAETETPVKELHTGINTYQIHYIHMKDFDADESLRRAEALQETTGLERADLVEILLTPLMAGESGIKERIRRTLRILRKERERLGEEDYRRMSSILYALATKFLKEDDLNEMKEEFGMTILGQMLYDDGRKAGLEEGKVEGRAEGKAEGAEMNLIRNICSLMETMKLSAEQAMEALQVPKAEWGKYLKLL